MKRMMALMALTATLTACDYIQRADSRDEQDDRLYRAAMDDYRAGRLDAALKGFEKAAAKNPANASARFQLACLLQDSRRDFVGAYCAYREFLLQRPTSDKAKIAKDRLVTCEKEMARELATRFGLDGSAASSKGRADLVAALKAAEARVAASEKSLGESMARIRALSDERDRLLNVVRGMEAGGDLAKAETTAEARMLLEEGDADEVSEATRLVPPPPPTEDVEEFRQKSVAKEKPKEEPKEPAPELPKRPAEYKVKEGDTLYGIAKRFYGEVSAWKKIRDANKALISTDSRLRAGDVIRLP